MRLVRPSNRHLFALVALAATCLSLDAAAQEAPEPPEQPEQPELTKPPAPDTTLAPEPVVLEPEAYDIEIDMYGYVRALFGVQEDDPNNPQFEGRNDGFNMANARLYVEASYLDLRTVISFEGAVDRRDARNTATGEVITRLKDAYAAYEPWPWLQVQMGQFKPPFNAEELQSTSDLLFVRRAVACRGVQGNEGRNVEGLCHDRQAGLMLHGTAIDLEESFPFALRYFASVTNGASANEVGNDNDDLAYFGRLELVFGEWASVGGGVSYNEVTTGEPPDLTAEEQLQFAVDVGADIYGVLLGGEFIQRDSTFPDVPAEPDRIARGYHAYIGYDAPWGLVPAYRFAFFDPTAEFEAEDPTRSGNLDIDEVIHHTAGLTWNVPSYPLKLQANYTVVLEDDEASLDNDRFDILVQAEF